MGWRLRGENQDYRHKGRRKHSRRTPTKSALRIKRWGSSCPIAKPSLLLIVACVLPRDERGNATRSRLYFVGYATVKRQGI